MLSQIEFIINKKELIKALEFLSPFIVNREEEYDFKTIHTSKSIFFLKTFFSNKVTFLLYKTHACISVLTEEGVRIEKTCGIVSNVEEISFCMPHDYLLEEVVKYDAETFSFKEDRFSGFNVFDTVSGDYLFDMIAHSVSKQPLIYPSSYDTHYPNNVAIEKDTLIKVLKEFSKYADGDPMHPYTEHIWFYVTDGSCRVIACSGHELRQEVFPTRERGSHVLSLPGKYASRISDIIENWADNACQQIGYNNNYLRFYNLNRSELFRETIELPLCEKELPSIQSILENRNITYRSSVHLKDLQSALKMINTMKHKQDFVLLHFFPNHVNLYNQGLSFEDPVCCFIDAESSDSERTMSVHQKTLEAVLGEINTDKVFFTLVDDNLLYINNEDEPLFKDLVRLLKIRNLFGEELKLLERGDNYLNSNEGYIEKYITKHDDEDDSPEEEYSIIDEMKAEALFRMKEVIDYTPIIDYFEETGLPQVYEPPFGASYSLEEDELEKVREIEDSRNILVWGVVRCFMKYNGQEVTVDCLLHVSQDKDEWEQEREDLRNGIPFVYTVMKEFPLIDHGHINVYKSKGGTLLRG